MSTPCPIPGGPAAAWRRRSSCWRGLAPVRWSGATCRRTLRNIAGRRWLRPPAAKGCSGSAGVCWKRTAQEKSRDGLESRLQKSASWMGVLGGQGRGQALGAPCRLGWGAGLCRVGYGPCHLSAFICGLLPPWDFLVVHWLKLHLPMQGAWVWSWSEN